ncbi:MULTISPECIES: ABC transporter ATP-binding protein [Rhizobium]|uniref:ATP-binding cassette domain-containing protein n=1 Tax=Rhizobium rhododendri TaxID=2506430 RepID=A0ABY8IL10_9HYPH|nr:MULTISPECIES: ATP-binding cassette domain-containing protein [Rhizobium]MBZ5758270.1 ATP-binding cassette domain-containing protein [Rhizobium sp. VS19-DR96]MBZ5764900.1 ATP-binding cassette domain-containing protein [Rhizobium sp. VS19-DR129.2]MBZ5772443.1 ATP-binding cassette domain-containing protein [Rhizobium sp. VS19-DRK62.2]MBZ5782870.1 ATP-binding cassette domain-containing protein [Rhizobium sp. VS19-DR121]MBZ5800318.1 ATP-binding cassette domain-containing protein [Rhizobium sp. V
MNVIAHPRFQPVEHKSTQPEAASAAPGAGAIRVRGLEKRFGDNQVLRGIDLDIPAGQFVAVIGKSGCGKSTLLRILMGLDAPTGGSVAFGTTSGEAAPNARIVFQEPRLLPWLSVADNVTVGLGEGVSKAEGRKAAARVLSEVQLAEKAGNWPAQLSGGQRQRVALARALVSKPGILALDEPLGALDALTRISMQELLNRVWRELGFTAVLVTHDVSEAVHLADRVIVLEEGGIALDLPVPHPHPRRHGNPALAELEGKLLAAILGH